MVVGCTDRGITRGGGAFAPSLRASPLPQQTDKGKPGLYWTFQTDKGDIVCKLYEVEAPVTVRTMVGLAFRKDLLRRSGNWPDREKEILRRLGHFHRVIS